MADEVDVTGGAVVDRIRLTDNGKRVHVQSQDDVVQYYRYNAERGDVHAQVVLGQLHYQGGHGVEPNLPEAMRFFDAAARAGDGNAMAYLGEMLASIFDFFFWLLVPLKKFTPFRYAMGRGVKQSNSTARDYYEKAAAKNSLAGMTGLASLYLNGQGIAKDYAAALKVLIGACLFVCFFFFFNF